mgnify:CR=1 FL=1
MTPAPKIDALNDLLHVRPIGIRRADEQRIARLLGNDPNVALPFTAVFDRSQRLAQHKFGATNAAELTQWTRIS